jgi:hypothetical protein
MWMMIVKASIKLVLVVQIHRPDLFHFHEEVNQQ